MTMRRRRAMMPAQTGTDSGAMLNQLKQAVVETAGNSEEAEEILEALDDVGQLPGGTELLFTQAAEELERGLGEQGISLGGDRREPARQMRLFNMGGPVEDRSGLKHYAEVVREGGRGDDDILLHVSPEEFDGLKAMWGEPEVNPITGIPEYGFLSKIWKKIKKGVKKIVKSPIFQFIAPIALNMFMPGLGAALGGALGATGSTAAMVGNTLIRGAIGAAGGGKKGFIRGALSTPGLGGKLGQAVGLTGRTADVIGSGVLGGLGSRVTGGDFRTGALQGAAEEYIRPGLQNVARKGLSTVAGAFGKTPPGATTAGTGTATTATPTAAGTAGAPPLKGGQAPGATKGTGLGDVAPLLLLSSLASKKQEPLGQAPLPEEFGEDLPLLDFNRRQAGGDFDYYTYGQTGAGQPGEHQFFSGNLLPSPSTPTGQVPGTVLPGGETPLIIPTVGGTPQYDPSKIPQRLAWEPAPSGVGGPGEFVDEVTGEIQDPSVVWEEYLRRQRAQGNFPGIDITPGSLSTIGFAEGGMSRADGHYYRGAGSGRDDTIEAMLSDGEYVMDAETVAMLGDGSNEEGARRLDEMRRNLRKHKGRNLTKGRFSADAKRPDQYFAKGGKVKKAAEELWEVFDKRTGKTVGKPVKGMRAAIRKVDRLDNQFGSYRYQKRRVEPQKKARGGSVSDDEILDIMERELEEG